MRLRTNEAFSYHAEPLNSSEFNKQKRHLPNLQRSGVSRMHLLLSPPISRFPFNQLIAYALGTKENASQKQIAKPGQALSQLDVTAGQ